MGAFENLMEAIETYSVANTGYKAAMENCLYGQDRRSLCAREHDAKETAKIQLKEALDYYVRYVVAMKEIG
jgi:hypothetical protein